MNGRDIAWIAVKVAMFLVLAGVTLVISAAMSFGGGADSDFRRGWIVTFYIGLPWLAFAIWVVRGLGRSQKTSLLIFLGATGTSFLVGRIGAWLIP